MQVVRPRNNHVAFRAEWPTAANTETACDTVDYNFICFFGEETAEGPPITVCKA